jgi:hypothetical protein
MGLKKSLPPTPDRSGLIDLYRELSRLTFKGEHRLAFAWVESEFHLGYDKLTRDAFNLFFNELGKVSRFGGSAHIAPAGQGSVTQHTLMCVPVLGLIAEEATERLDPKGQTTHAPRVANLRRDQIEQALVHDGGELLVEFSSLTQRWMAGDAEEKVDKAKLERSIAEFGLRLAFKVASTYRSPVKQEAEYGKIIQALRTELLSDIPQDPQMTQTSPEGRAAFLMHKMQRHLDIHHLTPAATSGLRHFMGAYDEPEGHSLWARFNGQVVKRAENIQSNLHFMEHCGQGGKPSWALAPSKDIVAGLWYSERDINKLFTAIRPGDAVEDAFARAAARLAYETNLALVQRGIPKFIDREAVLRRNLPTNPTAEQLLRAESLVTSADLRAQEIARTGARHATARTHALDYTLPEVSAKQLEWLYCGAMRWARDNSGYKPPEKALVYLREHPMALQRAIKEASPHTSDGTPQLVNALIADKPVRQHRPAAA